MTSFLLGWLGFSRDIALAIVVAIFFAMFCAICIAIVLFWLAFAIVAAVVSLPFFAIKKITRSGDF